MMSRWKTEFMKMLPASLIEKRITVKSNSAFQSSRGVLGRKSIEREITRKAYSILGQMEAENRK
jgi:hypothetical protein